MIHRTFAAASLLALAACNSGDAVSAQPETSATPTETQMTAGEAATPGKPFTEQVIGDFNEPWAMTFLPDGMLLITEKPGTMKFMEFSGTGGERTQRVGTVTGMPEVDYGGQGGLGDVAVDPDFATNRMIYISYAEAGEGDMRGAAVARGKLVCEQADECQFTDAEVIWRQDKTSGRGHYGHRIAFGPDGMLWISSGERQKFEPAQDLTDNRGSIIRLNRDGSVPADNPFAGEGGNAAQIWSYGHRNPLGLAFAPNGELWEIEMGPKGGDELNRIVRAENYGYPRVSNGDHYDGREIPDHFEGDGFHKPALSWSPVISPADLLIYTGDKFSAWTDKAMIPGLSSKSITVATLAEPSREVDRYDMGRRIRALEQGPDGYVYLLEDERDGGQGRLVKLVPAEG